MPFVTSITSQGSFSTTITQGEATFVLDQVSTPATFTASIAALGPKGDPGENGAAATIAVGTVTTLNPGDPATVSNAGTSSAAVFNFGIPQGPQGNQGIQGIQGVQGTPGTAATIAAGTVTTLSPGSPATVTNAGTSSAAVFNFGIPQGETGATGPQGPAGVVAATLPIAYDAPTQTVSLNSTSPEYGTLLASTLGLPTFAGSPQITVNTAGTNTILGRDSLYAKWFTGSEVADILGLGTAAYAATGDFYSSANPSGYVDAAGALAAVPDATDTVKGKVELATVAETQVGTDATRVVTVEDLTWGVAAYGARQSLTFGTSATSGTGSGANSFGEFGVSAGGPNVGLTGYAARILSGQTNTAYCRGAGSATIRWDKPILITGSFLVTLTMDVLNVFRFTVGKPPTPATIGNLSQRGFGFRFSGGGLLYLDAHNGTALTSVSTGITIPASQIGSIVRDFALFSDGAGNVTLYINDTQVATTNAGPTGAGSFYNNAIYVEMESTGVTTTGNGRVHTGGISAFFGR